MTGAEQGVPLALVVNDVRCELAEVYTANPTAAAKLDGLRARTHLQLSVTDSLDASPGLTLTAPAGATTLTIPLGDSFSGSGVRKTTVEFDTVMTQFKAGGPSAAADCVAADGLPRVQGGLGLASWLNDVVAALPKQEVAIQTLVYDVKFTVTRGVNGGVAFKVGNVAVDTGKPSPALKRVNENELIVSLIPPTGGGGGTHGTTPGAATPEENLRFDSLNGNSTQTQ